MESKKGVIEVQFNWIFILVAGALILTLFVGLVQKQGTISNQKRDVDIRGKLNTILVSAKQSVGTQFVISIPKTEITFGCNGYSVGGTNPFQLGESFSPSMIKSSDNTLVLQSLDWSVPYRISNFQYILTPDVRYVITPDSAYVNDVRRLLPDNISVTYFSGTNIADLGGMDDLNNYKVRLISVEEGGSGGQRPSAYGGFVPGWIVDMKKEDVTALHVVVMESPSGNPLNGWGILEFYSWDGSGFVLDKEYRYVKKETMLGAIVTDNHETFGCVFERVKSKFNMASDIYRKKSESLDGLYQFGVAAPYEGHCAIPSHYTLAVSKIDGMKTEMNKMPQPDLEQLYNKAYKEAGNLATMNRELLQKSCPLIY